jgi:hypothetical protein
MNYVLLNIDNGSVEEINEKFIFKAHHNFEGKPREKLLNLHDSLANVCDDIFQKETL